ncbi:MAG: phospho-N-acetylmuramoyl-pentapeptide-transferase [Verrucomicrobia bacterium]|nr:phospho-N-acetylmuramoyl-pentapeptide-transferase [Verrucomicrobiota bacterium]MCH8510878.1 phospho-N-acetylmuramoyl-pentapeptide-transferase [Kiritimatiellia bacterium]
MMYWIYEWWRDLQDPAWREALSPLRLLAYVTFRAMAGAATGFLLSLILGPWAIRKLLEMKIGQPVRDDEVLKMQRKKAGTPTMGGLLILGTLVVSVALWCRPGNPFAYLAMAAMLWMGGIGFLDDYMKVSKKNTAGLSGRLKLVGQFGWVVVLFYLMDTLPETQERSRQLMLPFLKDPVIPQMGLLVTVIFMTLVILGSSNAVNLTDGLDGLAIGCSNAVAVAYLAMSYVAGHVVFAEHLQVPYIAGSEELAVFFGCLLGSGLGFLWFNCHPARVFMGDTGSLALGGGIATAAILIKQEITLIFVGGIFVMEALSVVLQVASFKLTGKRIFRCAPIHHHFEMEAKDAAEREGRDVEVVETLVTIRFWVLAIIFAILGIATLKIR